MKGTDLEVTQAIVALIQAARQADAQAAILSVLMQALRADGGLLWQHGQTSSLGCVTQPAALTREGLRHLRLGRVYTAEDWPFHTLPVPPRGDARAMGVGHGDGAGWIILMRAQGQMRAIDTARLSGLEQALAQALELAGWHRHQMRQMAEMALALERLSVGLVRMDTPRTGTPQADATALALLAHHGLSLPALTRLWPRGPAGQVTDLGQGLDLVTVPRRDGPGMLGLLRPRLGHLPDAPTLAQALGLTLAEARFAHALARTDGITSAARQMGLTEATARFYSKQIFAKTGLPGQAALMRRIWASALVLLRATDGN